jgi:glycosyltransferase involved in cell wall biosynthesis
MTFSELPEALGDNDIFCYGYLHKEVANECDLYYKLLLSAKIFVNPASQWGGYSSTVEAMFYGCPVIVSPYDDFVENFGGEIDFGIYHTSGKLSDEIYAVLNMPTNDYRRMAKNGADRVKDYTWDNYVYHFLRDVVRD